MKLPRQIRISILILYIIIQQNSSFAGVIRSPYESTMINSFFKSLYNFSFHEADSIVAIMNNSDIDNITFSNIKANLAWWKLLSGDEIGSNIRTCDSILHESIRLGLNNKKKDISSILNLIYSYSLKARLENYRGKTLRSLIYFYRSITYIEECIKSPVKDEKLNLVLGLYFYFIDYIENEYFMINAMFFSFPKGDKNKGLRYLEECSASGDEMIRTEADYFLLKIYAGSEKDYSKALQNAQILTKEYPNNMVYCLEQLKLMLKMKKDGEARIFRNKIIDEIKSSKNINSSQKNHFISLIGDLSKPQ